VGQEAHLLHEVRQSSSWPGLAKPGHDEKMRQLNLKMR